MLAPFSLGPGDSAAGNRARTGVMSTLSCPPRGGSRIGARRPAGEAIDGQVLIFGWITGAHPAPVDAPMPIARLSMNRSLVSDARSLLRVSAFVCAIASSCTRCPVA